MNKSLKVIENMIELIYSEIKHASADPEINDASYSLLKEATIQAIELKRKVEVARGWVVVASK